MQDDDGIAKIEDFLDRIESPEESILRSFEEDFRIVKESLNLKEEYDNPEYLENKEKARIFKEQDTGAVITGATRTSDGFRECVYKGPTDEENRPHGSGSLVYMDGDTFTGEFRHGIRNRTGQAMFSQGPVSRIQGCWEEGFLFGWARVEAMEGGWWEGNYSF